MKWRHIWAATALVAITSTSNARAEEAQFTLLHDSYLHQTRYKFWQFSSQPQNWTTPVDYSHGTTYVRYEITSILQPAALQFCYFQDSHIPENHACAPEWRFDKPGVYYMKQDMGTIWQRSGIEWTRPLLDFMIIDNLSMGAAKVALTVDIVVVGAGAELHAPDTWNCPADWPCVDGGGGGGSGGTGGTSSGGAGGAGGTSSGGTGGTTGGAGGSSTGGSAAGGSSTGGASTGGSMATGGSGSGGSGSGSASSGGSSGSSGGGSGGSDSGGAPADGGSPGDGGSPSDGGSSNSGGSAGAGGTTTKPSPSTGGTSTTGGSSATGGKDDGEVKSHSLDAGDDSGCAWAPTPMTGGGTAWATLFGVLGWAAVRRRTRR